MNALHQYLFDTYRAARLGEPMPPAPGTHDVAVLRAARDRGRFERVVTGRRAGGGLRLRLRAALHRRRPSF
ncbi:hypothetical protein [Streptomyces globisporus]|uniref:hypothetical protein n=1 Tax=Streptomyces globisporus TaxID=1908 RepID=UPI0004CC638A|nr:hypothetical protein [Streptomyces globisporus]